MSLLPRRILVSVCQNGNHENESQINSLITVWGFAEEKLRGIPFRPKGAASAHVDNGGFDERKVILA